MKEISGAKNKHVLLGNGFSIALKPDIFSYNSLYDNADFTAIPHIQALFEVLNTRDFEIVIRHLQDAATVIEVYRPDLRDFSDKLRADAASLKDALVVAIAKRHPDRPFEVEPVQYAACRKFLSNFGHIFTLNYDVLLYWSLMQDKVDELVLRPDDGFRHPEDNPDEPYVSWQEANSPTVHYLHGALHLFDTGAEITKYTWSKTDKAIVDQIREALDVDKFPLFVAEGNSHSKRTRILHNAYLHKALRSFEACCKPAANAVVVYGHSLAENDKHIFRCISKGACGGLLVSLYGDPNSDDNKNVVKNAEKIVAQRKISRPHSPLEVTYYDATSVKLWG